MIDARQKMLATESIGKLLWKMSIPALIGGIVMTLYNIVDTIFIGQVVGPLGIAGLTIVFPIQMLGMGMGMMVGIGGSSMVSRALGAGDIDKANRTLGNAILYSIIIGVVVAIAGVIMPDFWLRLAGASETILPYARDYMIIVLLSMVFRVGGMGLSQLIRAEGNARVAMMCMSVPFALNIALDAVFILGLDMGIKGAALATALSEVFCCLYIAHYYFFRNSTLKIRIRNLLPDLGITREMMAIGIGSLVMSAGGSFVSIIINRTVVAYGGDMAVAAYGLVFRTMPFISLPLMSIGQGLQPILGFSYGARRSDRALKAIKLAVTAATLFSILSFTIIFFFPEQILRIFTQDIELLSVGAHAARIIFFTIYLMGFHMVASIIFQSLGRVIPTFLSSVSRQILFLLPLIYTLPKVWQLEGVWLAHPIADTLSFLLTLALFIPQIRKLRNLESLPPTENMTFGPAGQFAKASPPGGVQDGTDSIDRLVPADNETTGRQ